jgi:hypothetical protein
MNNVFAEVTTFLNAMKKKPFDAGWKDTDLSFFLLLMDHAQMFLLGGALTTKFEHFSISEEVSKINYISKCLSGPLEVEYLDYCFVQSLFPLNIVQVYAQIPRLSMDSSDTVTLSTLQHSVLDIFNKYHIQADTKFHAKLRVTDMPLLTFMQRNKIRQKNRVDGFICSKYFSSTFNLKEFTLRLIKRLFSPSISYAIPELHLQNVSLSILLSIFELGLFDLPELHKLTNILIEKLDHLVFQQRKFFHDYVQATDNHGLPAETIKDFCECYLNCKEIVLQVCIHIIFLFNDESVNTDITRGIFSKTIDTSETWSRAYFANPDITSVINRILTNYLMDFPLIPPREERPQLFTYLSDLISLTAESSMDIYLRSAQVCSPEDIHSFSLDPASIFDKQSMDKKVTLISHAEKLLMRSEDDDTLKDLYSILFRMKSYLGETDQYALGRVGVPRVLMYLLTILTDNHRDSDLHELCMKAIANLSKNNSVNQLALLHSDCHIHWRYLLAFDKFNALRLISEIFKEKIETLVIHKQVLNLFIDDFKCSLIPRLTRCPGSGVTLKCWLSKLLNPDTGESVLSDLLYFFKYMQLFKLVLSHKNTSVEDQFLNLSIQRLLFPPFFDIFADVLMDSDYLLKADKSVNPKTNSQLDCKPVLKLQYREQILNNIAHDKYFFTLTRKYSEGKMSSEHLTDLLFEIGIYCMSLIAECTHGLSDYSCYKNQMEAVVEKIIAATEYLSSLPIVGVKYRGIVLSFYSSIGVLQTYHLGHFLEETSNNFALAEKYCNVINNEIDSFVKQAEDLLKMEDKSVEKDAAVEYFYIGFIPLIYKLIQGMKVILPDTFENAKILHSLQKINDTLEYSQDYLCSHHSDLEVEDDLGCDAVSARHTLRNGIQERLTRSRLPSFVPFDQEEDKIEAKKHDLFYCAKMAIDNISNRLEYMCKETKFFLNKGIINNIDNLYHRPKLAEFNREFIGDSKEPIIEDADNEFLPLTSHKIIPLSDFEAFIKIMEAYRVQKHEELNKPPLENTFIRFLNCTSCNVYNIISFFNVLSKRYYYDLFKPQDGKISTSDGFFVMIENPIVFTMVSFITKVFVKCKPISLSLHEAASTHVCQLDLRVSDGTNWTAAFISILAVTYKNYTEYLLSKLFFDYEYAQLRAKQELLGKFFKNLCEDNNQPFKQYFNHNKLSLPGLAEFAANDKTLLDIFITIAKTILRSTAVHRINAPILLKEDRPEILWMFEGVLTILAETATGPCEANQLILFRSVTKECFSIIKRFVNSVDSTFNNTKCKAVDFLLSLTEGSNTEIITSFSTKIPFEELYELINTHIKILYTYVRYKDDSRSFNKTLLQRETEKNRFSTVVTDKESEKTSNPRLNDFYDLGRSINQHGQVDTLLITQTKLFFDATNNLLNPKIITKEMLNLMPVKHLEKIEDAYMKQSLFQAHIFMDIAVKLNDMLLKFSAVSNTYRTALQKIYRSMLDAFGDKIPNRVNFAIGMYMRKSVRGQIPEDIIIYTFITTIMSEVEVVNPTSKKSELIQFRRLPKTFRLSKISIDAFYKEADTDGMLLDLMEGFEKFNIEMEYNQKFYEKNFFFYLQMLKDSSESTSLSLWIIGVIINLVLIAGYNPDPNGAFITKRHKVTINLLSILLILLTFFRIVMWCLFPARQIVAITRAGIEAKEKKKNKGIRFRNFKIYFWRSVARESQMWNLLLYLIIPFLGMNVDPFFFTILPLMIVFLSNTLQTVAISLARHFKQFLLTLLLAVLVMYSYSVLTIGYFWRELEGNQSLENGPTNCLKTWDCFLFVVNYGLRMGGGLAEKTIALNPNNSSREYITKFLFDVLFFLVINIISLNIILSIIVDAFGGMREEINKRQELLDSVCMVCTDTRTNIERKGKSFKQHIEDLHNPLNYLYFLAYLYSKDPEDFTGLENSIYQQVINNQVSWVPFAK